MVTKGHWTHSFSQKKSNAWSLFLTPPFFSFQQHTICIIWVSNNSHLPSQQVSQEVYKIIFPFLLFIFLIHILGYFPKPKERAKVVPFSSCTQKALKIYLTSLLHFFFFFSFEVARFWQGKILCISRQIKD